ncbi:hypothetical protein [Hyphomicrobium sp.]|uniref:hypothetical protein n=1 Tax=Hyphomicrobium sp. TaxID=82 RepID=UPI001DED51EC|nr:hypothetical protein [Hyphomicrobium sp.]MBY0559893.1 hypothetical protein [Hyphomicrobium sp.]
MEQETSEKADAPDKKPAPQLHDWVKSTLGHGDAMCSRCLITNREAAVLGLLNHCERG